MAITTEGSREAVAIVQPDQSIADLHRILDENKTGHAVICDEGRYIGLVTRAQIAAVDNGNGSSAMLVGNLSNLESPMLPEHSSPLAIRHFLSHENTEYIPFVNRQGHMTSVLSRDEALRSGLYNNAAVIMAGGFGVRLQPITDSIPKPMVPLVDGRMIDRIINHLLDCGFYRFYVAVHYKKEMIMDYLGDGSDRGIEVKYMIEETPKGTAGSLRGLIDRETQPIVVTNGDVITNQRFGDILRFHKTHKADITIVCREDGVNISYGVVESDDEGNLLDINEKPRLNYLINTGMYVINPAVFENVPDKKCFMTDVIATTRDRGGVVKVFQCHEYWRDVGTIDCYAQVIKDIKSGLVRNLPPILPSNRSAHDLNGKGLSHEEMLESINGKG